MAREEIIRTGGGGGGGGAKKDSIEFKNSYAVRALTDIENLKLLAKLPVFDAQVENNRKGIVFELDELLSLGYKGNTTGAPMQMFNRIFDTLEIPFIAGTISRGGIKNVKITKYSDEFDSSRYATTRAGRPSKKEGTGIVDHEDSPEGLVACLEEWLADVAVEFDVEFIERLGLDRKMTELGLIGEDEDEDVEE